MGQSISTAMAGLILTAIAGSALAAPYTFTTIAVPGAASTQVNGINDVGQIVGTVSFPQASPQPFVETLSTSAISLYPNVGFFTAGTAINDQGTAVVNTARSGGTLGFLLDPTSGSYGAVPNFGAFPFGDDTTGINDAGQVVGNAYTSRLAAQSASFLYNSTTGASTTFSDPATLTFYDDGRSNTHGYTNAQDINNRGQVVGNIETILPGVDMRVMIQTGFLLDLASNVYTVIDVPGSDTTNAYGINDRGQVVGDDIVGSVTNGFVLDLSTGRYTTLTDPGATFIIPSGINNAGQIVGSLVDANGVLQAFLATPTASSISVPEPASLALLGGSILALTALRRKFTRPA